ncbi:MAG: hypothetical protein ACRDK4_05160 [Solirubrobacteraceae bacterium]
MSESERPVSTEREITVKRLESGYYQVRGRGPCNFAQPPRWPCDEETLRAHAFPEASEAFIQEVLRMMERLTEREERDDLERIAREKTSEVERAALAASPKTPQEQWARESNEHQVAHEEEQRQAASGGPFVGEIDGEGYEAALRDPDVQATLDRARQPEPSTSGEHWPKSVPCAMGAHDACDEVGVLRGCKCECHSPEPSTSGPSCTVCGDERILMEPDGSRVQPCYACQPAGTTIEQASRLTQAEPSTSGEEQEPFKIRRCLGCKRNAVSVGGEHGERWICPECGWTAADLVEVTLAAAPSPTVTDETTKLRALVKRLFEERNANCEIAVGLAERINHEFGDYGAYARAHDELIGDEDAEVEAVLGVAGEGER